MLNAEINSHILTPAAGFYPAERFDLVNWFMPLAISSAVIAYLFIKSEMLANEILSRHTSLGATSKYYLIYSCGLISSIWLTCCSNRFPIYNSAEEGALLGQLGVSAVLGMASVKPRAVPHLEKKLLCIFLMTCVLNMFALASTTPTSKYSILDYVSLQAAKASFICFNHLFGNLSARWLFS